MAQVVGADHWLALLRDGTPEQQALARTEIGLILESQGKTDEAARAYWTNVQARVNDPRPYYRLAAIHRRRGDEASAARALALIPPPDLPPQPAPPQAKRQPQVRRISRKLPTPLLVVISLACGALGTLLVVGFLFVAVFSSGSAASCANAGQRFPEWRDPDGAIKSTVAQIFRERGTNPFSTNPYMRMQLNAFALPPDEAVAGWMAHSLYWSHKLGEAQTMSLTTYVERQKQWRMALGSMLKPHHLAPILTREQWAEMQGWPASTCPGAMLRNPENTKLVRLMSGSVGDTAWLQR